ncbi:PorV/PorQ family protein [Luteibaculum oceani]|uniref:PorV/PorQ family protein n=1 Tax=Luteibaculum oceani TaxID=1294296 RepID=A0A5C6V2C7_9FLAO|nr:PorV/PorQ family protein [Luteibaculum oceani]TXC78811.1 PorV/PorQ family protein [Luteibaculum oceani]
MKKLSIFSAILFSALTAFSGNPDRAGEAGAPQLLVNPWSRSIGLMGSNVASSFGSEAIFTNVAGLAFINNTDILFSTTNYMGGAGIRNAALGFGQKLGESSVIGFNVVSMDFGDITRTTTDQPDGGIGTFSPTMTNIGISYAKAFSNSIYGGITFRFHQESIANTRGSGMAFDAGIRYVTGDRDNVRIGISLKNVGPSYAYEGDGLAVQAEDGSENQRSFFERTAGAELPASINLGFAYDFLLAENHELTFNGSFLSNSFIRDEILTGLEYNFNDRFNLRAGYSLERKSQENKSNLRAHTGLAVGASIKIPMNSNGSFLSIDYGYQPSNPFDGINSIGLNLSL